MIGRKLSYPGSSPASGGMAGISPRLGVRHMPRLRAETPACTKRFGEGMHFGVQARALSAGLHIRANAVNKLLISYRKVNRNLKLPVFGLAGF